MLDSATTSRDLYGDQGYVDGGREARFKVKGRQVHIQRKAAPGQPLCEWQKRRNTRIARTRTARARIRRPGADGRRAAARHWPGAHDLPAQREGRGLQPAPPVQPQGVRGGHLLTPEVGA